MMINENYNIFISYRRQGGSIYAQLIYYWMLSEGYQPFIDMEGLGSGHFDEKLLTVIAKAPVFVPVLSKGSLERCFTQKDDWVRKEIEYALLKEKQIVPFMTEDFSWPLEWPDENENEKHSFKSLHSWNGVIYSERQFVGVFSQFKKLLDQAFLNGDSFVANSSYNGTATISEELLEPYVEINIVHATKKSIFGRLVYKKDEKGRIFEECLKRMEGLWSDAKKIQQKPKIEAYEAYCAAYKIMKVVTDQVSFYTFWNWDADQAIEQFKRNYSINVLGMQDYIKTRRRFLTDDVRIVFEQYIKGFAELIDEFKSQY